MCQNQVAAFHPKKTAKREGEGRAKRSLLGEVPLNVCKTQKGKNDSMTTKS